MAQQSAQAINTGSGNTQGAPPRYASNAPEFLGGSVNPVTGETTPASQTLADTAPPPATPTTQLGSVTAPKPSSLPGVTGAYLGSTLGGALGSQIGQGASITGALSSTAANAGNELEFLGSPATVPYASSTSSLGGVAGGAIGAGLGAGVVTAGVGALEGEKSSVYLPQAAASTVGTGVGYVGGEVIGGFLGSLFGPAGTVAGAAIGGPVGGAIGGAVASAVPAVQSFFSHLFKS